MQDTSFPPIHRVEYQRHPGADRQWRRPHARAAGIAAAGEWHPHSLRRHPADSDELLARGAAHIKQGFAEVGDVAASTHGAGSPHPLMHRTESIDYGVVIEGELTLLLDEGEVVVRPGSVVVQRGTNHAWANRSGKPCRILFVLVSGQYEPALAAHFGAAK